MDKIIEKLREYREQRQQSMERKYSQIVLRFDDPKPDDAEVLNQVMQELGIGEEELQSDILLIRQYRAYLAEDKTGGAGSSRGGKEDAQNIRKMHRRLFLAMEKEK